jgi:hypothetical protein
MNLPNEPGLLRRLSYGEYIRRLHFNRTETYNESRNIAYTMEPQTYEELSELKNVEIGLSLEDLLVNTKIEMQNLLFFCAICQDIQADIQAETKISRVLICHHKFHIGCIEFWLSKNKTCPICRYDISCKN